MHLTKTEENAPSYWMNARRILSVCVLCALASLTMCTAGCSRSARARANPLTLIDRLDFVRESFEKDYWQDAVEAIQRVDAKAKRSGVDCGFNLDIGRPQTVPGYMLPKGFYDGRTQTVHYPIGKYRILGHEYAHHIIAQNNLSESCYREVIAYLVGDNIVLKKDKERAERLARYSR